MKGKIQVDNPVVDMDGDEMTRVIWQKIKDQACFSGFKPFEIVDYAVSEHPYSVLRPRHPQPR